MVIGGSHRGWICDRAPLLRAAPDARRQTTARPSTWSRGWLFRMGPMEVSGERGIQNVLGADPGPLLRAVPLPIHQVLNYPAPATGVKNFLHSVHLLAVYDDGGGAPWSSASSWSSAPLEPPAGLSRDT